MPLKDKNKHKDEVKQEVRNSDKSQEVKTAQAAENKDSSTSSKSSGIHQNNTGSTIIQVGNKQESNEIQGSEDDEVMGSAERGKPKKDKIGKIADDLFNLAQSAINQAKIKSKLKALNSVQLATVAAIAVDKYQLLTGGATDRREVQMTDRNELLKRLKGNKHTEKSMQFESAKNKQDNEKSKKIVNSREEQIKKALKIQPKIVN